VLAQTDAKYSLALILEGPDLLNVVRPLKAPDSLNFGINPKYAATCLALLKDLAEKK